MSLLCRLVKVNKGFLRAKFIYFFDDKNSNFLMQKRGAKYVTFLENTQPRSLVFSIHNLFPFQVEFNLSLFDRICDFF